MTDLQTKFLRQSIKLNQEQQKNMLRKSIEFEVRKAEKIDSDGVPIGVIEGYASTFGNIDRQNDVILEGAFDATIADHQQRNRPIRMLYQHMFSDLIGGFPADMVQIDAKGLLVVGHINLATARGQESYALAQQGVLSDMSIGFKIDQSDIVASGSDYVRQIKQISLFEISLVGEPANPQAQILGVKSMDIDSLKDLNEIQLEAALIEGQPMSKTSAKALVSAWKLKQREAETAKQREVDPQTEQWAELTRELNKIRGL